MTEVPRRYLLAAVFIVVAAGSAWFLFPRKPFDVGMALSRSGKPVQALAVWERACDGGDADSCAQASLLRASRGEMEPARELFAKAKAIAPKDVWVLLLEGSFLELDGKPTEARALYEEAERLHPHSGLPATSLAKLALASNDLPEAERSSERAIAAEPTLGAAYAMKGRVLVATSSLREALTSFSHAMDYDGMGEIDWVALAEAVRRTGGTPQDELSILEDAALRHPDSSMILVPLGIARATSGDPRGGLEALRLACDLAPDLVEPRIVIGILFLEMGNPGFAVPRLEEALKIDPGNVEAARLLAMAWTRMGEREKALPAIAALLARTDLAQDQRVLTLYLRARSFSEDGKTAEAMEDVKRILALDPKMHQANWLCGHLELEAGHLDEARRCLDAAVIPGEPDCDVMRDFARLAVRQERLDEAVVTLQGLAQVCGLDKDWIRANPEFRVLERNETFRLLMEGAAPAPAATETP